MKPTHLGPAAVSLACAALLAGCGQPFVASGAAGGGAGGAGGAGAGAGGAGVAGAGGAPGCTTAADCGPLQQCVDQECACLPGATPCGQACVATATDPRNCGACGVECPAACKEGRCDAPVDIAAGGDTTCAVLFSGDVHCWGGGESGQLGTGHGGEPSATPVHVPLPAPAVRIAVGKAAGDTHVCALTAGSMLLCWGSNQLGKLGIGDVGATPRPPAAIPGLRGVASFALGAQHACAVLASKQMLCWGSNALLQLGSAGFGFSPSPADHSLNADAVGSGHDTACATYGSAIACWGRNDQGQIGNGTVSAASLPDILDPLGDAPLEVVGGASHTCARMAAGGVRCWGGNIHGQLGTGHVKRRTRPTAVPGLAAVSAIAAGADHTAAVAAGEAWLWGKNDDGQVSADEPAKAVLSPLPHPAIQGAARVALGAAHSCALLDDGHILCWGRNDKGQLGTGEVGGTRRPPAPVVFE